MNNATRNMISSVTSDRSKPETLTQQKERLSNTYNKLVALRIELDSLLAHLTQPYPPAPSSGVAGKEATPAPSSPFQHINELIVKIEEEHSAVVETVHKIAVILE